FATMADTSEIFVYHAGVYRANAEAVIRAYVEHALIEDEDSAKKGLVEEVVDAVRRRTYVDRKEFNSAMKMSLLNGILDIAGLVVTPHTPNDRFTIQLPVSFAADAKCPTFIRFLEEILPNSRDRE